MCVSLNLNNLVAVVITFVDLTKELWLIENFFDGINSLIIRNRSW